jgi:amino acid permease
MKINSYMSVCSTTVLLLILTVRSAQCLTGHLHGEEFYWCRFPRYDETRAAAMPKSLFDALLAIPVMAGAFVCHFNVLPMHAELKRPTYDRVMRVINQTFTLVALGYISIGVVGFLPLGREVCDNILLNYSANDMLVNVGRLALSCTLTLSYPNLILPCRTTLVRLINTTWGPPEGMQQLMVSEAAPLLSPGPRALEPETPRALAQKMDYLDMDDFRTRFAVTLALVAGAGSVASLTSKVSTIWSLLGCTIVSLIAFILPCALYLRICRPKGRARLAPTTIIWVSSFMSLACVVAAFMDFSRTNPSLSQNTFPCETRQHGAEFVPTCLFPTKHHVILPP